MDTQLDDTTAATSTHPTQADQELRAQTERQIPERTVELMAGLIAGMARVGRPAR